MSNAVQDQVVDQINDLLAESKFVEAQELIDKYELDYTVTDILEQFGGCCSAGIDDGGFCKACKEHCL